MNDAHFDVQERERLLAQLPPRPDPQTGQPFPPFPPGSDPNGKPELDRHRETRLSRKPSPPPGLGPVLAWYGESRHGKVFRAIFGLIFLAAGMSVLAAFQGESPFAWVGAWPVWLIFIVGTLLMSKPWKLGTTYAGADWLTGKAGRKDPNQALMLYEIVKVRTSVAAGHRYLRLEDRNGYWLDMTFSAWQKDARIWALVYNGILHSVANGADIRLGDAKGLGFEDSPAIKLNEQLRGKLL